MYDGPSRCSSMSRYVEALVVGDREPAELQTVVRAGLVLDRFVGRDRGRDKRHRVQSELTVCLLCAHEVTKMWRVEGAAEDSDAHGAQGEASAADLTFAVDEVLERAQLLQADRPTRV